MHPNERNDALRVGTAIRAARKYRALSQTEVARQLSISQVALSKIENGQTSLSSSTWYHLTKILNISPDFTFFEGVVDQAGLETPPKLEETGFRVSSKFCRYAHSTIRSGQPVFSFFEQELGSKHLTNFIRDQLKTDPDIRRVYNLKISIRFHYEIIHHLISCGALTLDKTPKLLQYVSTPQMHGALRGHYSNVMSPLNKVRKLVEHSSNYEENFNYEIISESRNEIEILSKPQEFMKDFLKKEKVLASFLDHYRTGFIQNFSSYGEAKNNTSPIHVHKISDNKRTFESIFKVAV